MKRWNQPTITNCLTTLGIPVPANASEEWWDAWIWATKQCAK